LQHLQKETITGTSGLTAAAFNDRAREDISVNRTANRSIKMRASDRSIKRSPKVWRKTFVAQRRGPTIS
jgi:hypothetical protein